jgi:hypothetical protein
MAVPPWRQTGFSVPISKSFPPGPQEIELKKKKKITESPQSLSQNSSCASLLEIIFRKFWLLPSKPNSSQPCRNKICNPKYDTYFFSFRILGDKNASRN